MPEGGVSSTRAGLALGRRDTGEGALSSATAWAAWGLPAPQGLRAIRDAPGGY